jgi:hypothetical protein
VSADAALQARFHVDGLEAPLRVLEPCGHRVALLPQVGERDALLADRPHFLFDRRLLRDEVLALRLELLHLEVARIREVAKLDADVRGAGRDLRLEQSQLVLDVDDGRVLGAVPVDLLHAQQPVLERAFLRVEGAEDLVVLRQLLLGSVGRRDVRDGLRRIDRGDLDV